MKKIILPIVAIIIVVLLLVFRAPTVLKNEPIRLGIATLLTGDFAVLGDNVVKTATLAVNDINANGGINGQQIELFVEDAKYNSADGLSAVQKLINVDKIDYLIAAMSSNGTLAAAPVLNINEVLAMTPVTGGKNVDDAGEYIFRIANSDLLAGKDLADAMIKLGYRNVGVVAEITEYTIDIKNTFEQEIKEKGGKIVVSEEFNSNTKDYRTMVKKIQSGNPQALLVLSALGTNAGQFIKQSRELGYRVPLFTDFTFIANSDVKKIINSFEGIYFADPAFDANATATKAFFEKYETAYGNQPPIPFHSASTYDGIMMLRDAIEAKGNNKEAVKDWLLSNIKNRTGLMGTFSLDSKGNSDLGFIVKVIKAGKPVEIK